MEIDEQMLPVDISNETTTPPDKIKHILETPKSNILNTAKKSSKAQKQLATTNTKPPPVGIMNFFKKI